MSDWSNIKKIIFIPFLLGIIGVIGYILLVCVYCIPTRTLQENVQKSCYYFERESNYPRLMQGENSQLDNFTDALMLLTASHSIEENVWDSAVNVTCYREQGIKSVDTLLKIYKDGDTDVNKESYARYWHGYLIFLKPLLTVMDYGQIRSMVMFAQLLLFCVVLVDLSKKKRTLIYPLFAMWIFLNPVATMLSLQYNTVLMITLLSIYAILKMEKRWSSENLYEWSIAFLIIGAMTSYFDLLTYPLVTLGIPVISWLAIYFSKKTITNIYKTMCLSAAWFLGYGGIWAFKWILGSVITGENIIANALSSVAERTSADVSDTMLTFMSVLKKQIISADQDTWKMLIVFGMILFIYYFIKGKKMDWNTIITFAVVAMLPFGWYFVLKNHSYIHSFFAYRELAISIFAFLACIMLHIGEKPNG